MENTMLDFDTWKNAYPNLYADLLKIAWRPIKGTEGLHSFNGPFLSFPKPGFLNLERRILIFGQETYGWSGSGYEDRSPEIVIRTAFDVYNIFFFSGSTVETRKNRYYHAVHYPSPFWRAFKTAAGAEYRDAVWCNLMPFDCYDSKNNIAPSLITHHAGTEESKYAWARAKELVALYIKTLNPTHILFFTGPQYDQVILDVIPGSQFQNQLPDALSLKVPLSKGAAPTETLRMLHIPGWNGRALRTYHPNFMSFRGAWKDFLRTLRHFTEQE